VTATAGLPDGYRIRRNLPIVATALGVSSGCSWENFMRLNRLPFCALALSLGQRPHYGRPAMNRRIASIGVAALAVALLTSQSVAAQTIQGRWRLLAAEDLRADGTVARHPWGRNPVGSIVVEGGWCYIQIMSSDTPSFPAKDVAPGEQMKSALLGTYIAYTGPCVTDDTAGTVVLKVEAAWRPDYVGTEQRRFYRFENGRLLFGPAPNSIRSGEERWTRRLTLECVP
jgi:hypothetical protein